MSRESIDLSMAVDDDMVAFPRVVRPAVVRKTFVRAGTGRHFVPSRLLLSTSVAGIAHGPAGRDKTKQAGLD
jgi:hypothetical protein